MHRFALILLLLPGALAAAPHSGLVRFAERPIPGATVTATLGNTVLCTATDDSGRYTFETLDPGVWLVEVEIFGFVKTGRPLLVRDEPSSLEWLMELQPSAPSSPLAAPGGFVSLSLHATAEAPPAAEPPKAEPETASESFLVAGSLSQGLENPQREEAKKYDWKKAVAASRAGAAPARLPSIFAGDGGGGKAGKGKRGGLSQGFGKRAGLPGDRVASFGNKRRKEPIRGSAYYSLRNSALDARPYSLTGQTMAKPSYAQSRFGVSAGGQLKIPKLISLERTFFFVNYTGMRSRNPYNAVTTVPTALERSGDFSQSVARWPVQVYDPNSRLPFPDNRIPQDRWNPAVRPLLSFVPLPNQPGRVQNFQYTASIPNNTDSLGVRLNQTVSRRNRLDFNVNFQNRGGEISQLFGFRDANNGLGFNSTAGWVHNFGPRAINSLRWNFSRNHTEMVPYFAYGRDVADELGIQGTSHEPVNYGPPNLSFTNFGALSDGAAILRRDQTSSVTEGFTLIRKGHNLNMGAEYRRMQLNSRAYQNARGSFSFSGLKTSALDAKNQPLPGTGYDFADFLLGFPQSSSIRFGSENTYFRSSATSVWGADDWRLRPNLTFNVGLRYEFFTPMHEKFGHMANLDIAPDFTGVAVVLPGQSGPWSGPFPDGLIDPDHNNFSPRVGVAWRPVPKKQLQIRAGYGIFYSAAIYNQFPARLASQPPFAKTASLTTSLARPLTLQNGFASEPSNTITNTFAVDRFYRMGYAQTWNLAVQHTLRPSLVVELVYLGTKGTRLDIQRLPNRAPPGSPLTAEQRRIIGNAVGFTFDTPIGNSIYHSGQVRVTRRFHKGFSANAVYVWAKTLDNASTFGGVGGTVAQNDKDLSAERGLSIFDQRHTLTLYYMVTTPTEHAGRFLANWNFSGGVTASSGLPLTARVLGNLANSGGTGVVGSGRADASGLPVHGGPGFFNLQAFTIPPSGRFGNAGRNTVPGPSRLVLNLSLGRSFKVGDGKQRLELRVDGNNFLNHVSYTTFGTVVNAANYGLPLATLPMRSVFTTLRYRF